MASSSSTTLVSCAILVILVMCQPVQAQEPQKEVIDLAPLIEAQAVTGRSSGGSSSSSSRSGGRGGGAGARPAGGGAARDAILNALRSIDADPRVIQSIAAALPNDNAALRDLLIPVTPAASGARQVRTPAQAVVAFNDEVNSAFRNATDALTETIFPVRASHNRPMASPAGGSGSGAGTFPGVVAGFGVPLDPSVYGAGFNAGVGLPPLASADSAAFSTFSVQLIDDLGRQRQNFAAQADSFQRSARQKSRVDRTLNDACVQYALSQFLGSAANLVLGLNLPAAGVLGVLGQLAGLGYTGLTPQGTAYMGAFCCDRVRRSGIDLTATIGDGTLTLGGITVDLPALLAALPDLTATLVPPGTPAAADVAAITSAVSTAVDAVSGVVSSGAITGLPECGLLDWAAFALQGDPRLLNKFVDLIKASLKLEVRLIRKAIDGADKASNRAADLIKRLGRSDAGRAAVAADPAFGKVIDAAVAGASGGVALLP